MPASDHPLRIAAWLLRFALAASFLSAVADRCGLSRSARRSRRRLGRLAPLPRRCLRNAVATLNSFAPKAAIPALGWIATIAEVVLAFGLLIGWRLKIVALLSALLLLSLALTMTFSVGVNAPLDYSVFTAAAAAFALAALASQVRQGAPNGREPHSAPGQ